MTTADTAAATPANAPRDAGRVGRIGALRLLWHSALPDRADAVRAAAWLVVAGLLEAAGPLLGKRFIDSHLVPRAADFAMIALLLGGAFACGALSSVLRYLQLLRLAGLSMRSVQRLRERVYAHVLRMPMRFFDRAITGQLVTRITNDTESVKQLYTQVLFEMLVGVTLLIGVVIAMLWLDWRLMLVVLLLVPITAAIVWAYERLSAAAAARTRELRSDINAQMAEGIAGMSVLQAAGAVRRFAARFARTNDLHYAARRETLRANAWLLRPALDFVNILLIAVIVIAVGTDSVHVVEVGLLYAFIAYVARVHGPFVSDEEVQAVADFWRGQGEPDYIDAVTNDPEGDDGFAMEGGPSGDDSPEDQLYRRACQLVAESQKASTSWLQRQLRVGYNSAARLIERMEKDGLVSRPDHVGRREVLMDPDGRPLN